MRLVSRILWFSFLTFLSVLSAQAAKETIDASNYFPLIPGNWWEFKGVDLKSGGTFKTLLAVGQQKKICGVTVTPLLFFKDQRYGYWGPGDDLNLEWLLVDFSAENSKYPDFLWVVGDRRYNRDLANFENLGAFQSFTAYVSIGDTPPYAIFPKHLSLGASKSFDQTYYEIKEDRDDCDWIGRDRGIGAAEWDLDYETQEIREPVFAGKTIRVRFKEDFGDKGWLEDWYFAKDIGPVKIETFSQGQKLTDNMSATHRLELASYFVKNREGKSKTPPIATR